MDDLEIKIAITYKVPKINLTLNGLLRGLDRDRDAIMRAIVVKIFEALEEKLQEDYPPEQYAWNGHQSSARRLLTSFGEVRYSLAQVTERKTGKSINPLVVKLKIPAYRHYPGEALEASLGQAIHLSYRLAAKETKRIRGSGPGKSALWSRPTLPDGSGQEHSRLDKKVKSGAAENSAVLWSDLLSTAIDMIPWTKAEITSGKIRGYEGYKLREHYKKYPNLEANNPISWIYP